MEPATRRQQPDSQPRDRPAIDEPTIGQRHIDDEPDKLMTTTGLTTARPELALIGSAIDDGCWLEERRPKRNFGQKGEEEESKKTEKNKK